MRDIAGHEVWVVEYDEPHLAVQFNGVFSTFQKAIASFHTAHEKCKDYWFEFYEDTMCDHDDTVYGEFRLIYPPYEIDEYCCCIIYRTRIQ